MTIKLVQIFYKKIIYYLYYCRYFNDNIIGTYVKEARVTDRKVGYSYLSLVMKTVKWGIVISILLMHGAWFLLLVAVVQ